jgi:hypothetical protein
VNNDYRACSNGGVVKHGVPQGLLLETLLFLLYINYIMKIPSTKIITINPNEFYLQMIPV